MVLVYSPLFPYALVESSGTELITSPGLVSGLSLSCVIVFLPGHVLSWEIPQCLSSWTRRELIVLLSVSLVMSPARLSLKYLPLPMVFAGDCSARVFFL